MPRDLNLSSSPVVASPESKTPRPEDNEETALRDDNFKEFTIHRDERHLSMQLLREGRAKADGRNELHPYVQTLSFSNLESCIALEDAIFPPQERCTRDKFEYRLSVAPELALGLFSTMTSDQDLSSVPTYEHARPAYSAQASRKQTLVGMVIATKTSAPGVTDASMERPDGPIDGRGHHEAGRTICIHSFGILPAFQGRGLGKVLFKSYLSRMESSGIADRIALISHEQLTGMYTNLGFMNKGKSDVKFGGGGWTDLVRMLLRSWIRSQDLALTRTFRPTNLTTTYQDLAFKDDGMISDGHRSYMY
ncbi:uncharacterized protein KY384_003317 [Bacidia gigantensis]|uniref:uncharacterized protein n=1 Tax=Bacidia gigantensis TaxID=2732470 RepID=UPI001D053F99|nr:uncharacterized protein KY384_003317 [Bacidia gigantensis]KAG8531685.1 hypothetical protein KY384_003317 [Bacidia gigantensis]